MAERSARLCRSLVFLDMDGVVNSAKWQRDSPNKMYLGDDAVDDAAIVHLNKIIKAAQSEIVISSSWRKVYSLQEMRQILARHDCCGDVIGRTTGYLGQGKQRGHEIAHWLENAPLYGYTNIEAFVILDDDSDMHAMSDHLVLTSYEFGLTDADAERAIQILSQPIAQHIQDELRWRKPDDVVQG